MAASRSRRSNAGNKMASLLDTEEVDEFYATTYGGFSEEAEDKEYIVEPTESKRPRYILDNNWHFILIKYSPIYANDNSWPDNIVYFFSKVAL